MVLPEESVQPTVPCKGERDIILDLLEVDVCKRCCLRILNEKDLNKYKDADTVINGILNISCDEVPCKVKKSNPCSVCLGLLEPDTVEQMIEDISTQVCAAQFDSDHMTCALSFPIAYQLRSHSIWLYILSKHKKYFLDKHASYLPDKFKPEFITMSIKEVWKLLTATKLSRNVKKILTNDTNRYFIVNINIAYENDEDETKCLISMRPSVFKDRSSQKKKFHGEVLTRKSVDLVLSEFESVDSFKKYYPVPPTTPTAQITYSSIQFTHDSLYIAGRYNKFSRNLSQTPWIVHGEKRMESSIQDIVTKPLSNIIKNDGYTFIGSGREDVDVRMLGKGRPFVIEIINPRRTKLTDKDCKLMESAINNSSSDIFIRDLQQVKKEETYKIKIGEESKTKTYKCYCVIHMNQESDIDERVCSIKEKLKKLELLKDIVLDQKTPIRVLHRRPLTIRKRSVYWLKAEFCNVDANSLYFYLTLNVQAGTYIKEFVHGDFCRTKPNLTDLLDEEVDILALDVEAIHLDWPPTIE